MKTRLSFHQFFGLAHGFVSGRQAGSREELHRLHLRFYELLGDLLAG